MRGSSATDAICLNQSSPSPSPFRRERPPHRAYLRTIRLNTQLTIDQHYLLTKKHGKGVDTFAALLLQTAFHPQFDSYEKEIRFQIRTWPSQPVGRRVVGPELSWTCPSFSNRDSKGGSFYPKAARRSRVLQSPRAARIDSLFTWAGARNSCVEAGC